MHLARRTVTQLIKKNKILNYKTQNKNFLVDKGAFVTIKKHNRLRGCIGYIKPIMPLYQTVIQAAAYAACKDPRFPPLTPEELKNLEIEISVLSPLIKITNPHIIKVGKHGLVISKGDHKGLLLPQVPVENHWSRKEFLEHTCLKAGLPSGAWKSGADIYIFEAIIIYFN